MPVAGCFSLSGLSCIQRNAEVEAADGSSLTTPLEYARASGIETFRILELAATLIPIPFLQDVFKAAYAVLLACDETTRIEKKARELGRRVGILMIAILDNITSAHDDIKAITNAAEKIQGDVQDLMNALRIIMNNLEDINGQNRFQLFFFREFNKSRIDDCLSRLASALERFNVNHNFRSLKALQNIQPRLEKIQGLTQGIADDVLHLHKKVDKLDTILTSLSNLPAHRGPASPTLRRQRNPSKPRVFHGRTDVVQEIAHLLCSERASRVCILGPGGMGKTSLALAVVESSIVQTKYGALCFWVPCIEAASPYLLLHLLYVHLRIVRATDDTLDDILSELNSSKEPRLVLLDNFETPWFPSDGNRQEVGDILRQISQLPHVAILMTMRGGNPPCDDIMWQPKHLEALDEHSSRSIFHEIDPKSKGDPDVDGLLAAVGRMPFAVTLMAKLGKKARSSAKELLVEWMQAGTDIISNSTSTEENMNRTISLSVDRNFVQQDRDALLLLETLSLLPAGTSKANLHWWAPNMKSRSPAIATLSDAALLSVGNKDDHSTEATRLFVIPVVQSFMSTTNRIQESTRHLVQEACLRYVCHHGGRYYDADFNRKSKALAAEDTNIQSILTSLPVSEDVIKAHLHFTWYRFDTRPSIEIAQRTLDLARSLGEDRYISEALCALGGTYYRLSKEDLAIQALTEVSHPTAECISLLTDARMDCNVSADSTLSLIYGVQPKFSDDFDRAHILKAIGVCLLRKGQHAEAITVLDEARDIFERLKSPTDVTHTIIRIVRGYRALSQFSKALEAITEASRIINDVNHPRMRADTECQHARVLLGLGHYAEARSKFERCLLSFQRLGSPMMIGEVLENIGDSYVGDQDYQRASASYEAAMEKFKGLKSSLAKQTMERCIQVLEWINRREQNSEVHPEFDRISILG